MLVFFAQVDFARAYDSVLHSAVVRAMLRRGVPPPIGAAYVCDMRGTELVFQRAKLQTQGIRPTVGLRQGCSLSPLVFRWVMEDLVAEARREWNAAGCGFQMDDELLHILAWADDTWLFASSRRQLCRMVGILRRVAEQVVGLELRLDKCTWAEVRRKDQSTHAGLGESTHLQHMAKVEPETWLKLLGA